MKNYTENIEKAKKFMRIRNYYGSINGLMEWDLWQGLSEEGRPYRYEVQGYFIREALELVTSIETAKQAEYFRGLSASDYANDYDRALGRTVVKLYDRACRVPADLQIELNNFTSKAQMVWREAREKADFNMYRPYLKGLFEIEKRVAEAIDPNRKPFDVLIDEVDEGLSVDKTGQLFSELKSAIVKMLDKIKSSGKFIDDSMLDIAFDKETLKELGIKILTSTGFDTRRGGFAEVLHPVCYGTGPRDARITVNYNNVMHTLFSFLHEGGHGMYNYRSDDRAIEYGIWGGVGGAVHESQSRFYENIIGKSYEFWQCFYPLLQSTFLSLSGVELADFYAAINKVNPSPMRLSADELTYSLHPIIRFEIEKDYFEGRITTDDFREVWNAKYKEYLGVEPDNDREGVLQDVHWASGHVGYFQSYTLGNLWGGQIRHTMLKAIPNVYNEVAKGNFSPLNTWLTDNIHRLGQLYTPKELILKVTGEELKSCYFIDYLNEKYSKIYGYEM